MCGDTYVVSMVWKMVNYVMYNPLLFASDASTESAVSPLPARGITSLGGKTALELMRQEELQTGIVTFSAQIDEMLGVKYNVYLQ